MNTLKLIYITGIGRNGSTLISRILGEDSICINVGEALSYMLNSKLRERHKEVVLNSCFWQEVFKEIGFNCIEGNFDNYISEKSRSKLINKVNSGSDEFQNIQNKIIVFLNAIKNISGKEVIVDSSKFPNIPLFLLNNKIVDIYILHVIRDIGSVIKSRSVKKGYLDKAPFFNIIARWIRKNNSAYELKKYYPYKLFFYEDFCKEPFNKTIELYKWAKINNNPNDLLKQRKVEFSFQPIVAGNPDKFSEGLITIREVKKEKFSLKFLFAKLIAFPWIYRFKL